MVAAVVPVLQAGLAGPLGYILTAVAALYGAGALLRAVQAATGLTAVKMALAAAATVVYVGCFLYLWM